MFNTLPFCHNFLALFDRLNERSRVTDGHGNVQTTKGQLYFKIRVDVFYVFRSVHRVHQKRFLPSKFLDISEHSIHFMNVHVTFMKTVRKEEWFNDERLETLEPERRKT